MTERTEVEEYGSGENEAEAPQWVKDLRKEVKELRPMKDQVSSLKRENLLLRANVDLDAPQTELFVNGWKGNWDDAEAVKEAIGKYGVPTVKSESTSETSETPPAEEEAHRQFEQASEGGQSLPPANQEPDWHSFKSPEELLAAARAAGVETAELYD